MLDYVNGEIEAAYDEEEFLLNAGAYFGVIAHHVADLHTPVHVGTKLPMEAVGHKSRSGFHSRVEADLGRASKALETIKPYRPKCIELTSSRLERVAQSVYEEAYLNLLDVYSACCGQEARCRLLKGCISGAACCTADVWTTVLSVVGPEAMATLMNLSRASCYQE